MSETLLDVLRAMRSASMQCYGFAERIQNALISDGEQRTARDRAAQGGDTRPAAEAVGVFQGVPVYANARMAPDDWVLVPREATPEMLEAFQEEQCHWSNVTHTDDRATMRLWAAMLTAAPSQPEGDAASG